VLLESFVVLLDQECAFVVIQLLSRGFAVSLSDVHKLLNILGLSKEYQGVIRVCLCVDSMMVEEGQVWLNANDE